MSKNEVHTLVIPEFESTIPEWLIKELDPASQHAVHTSSITEQKIKWLEEKVVTEDTERQKIANAIEPILILKERLTGGWGMVLVIGSVIGFVVSLVSAVGSILRAMNGGG